VLPGLWALTLAKEACGTPKQMAQLSLLLLQPWPAFRDKTERRQGNRMLHLTATYPSLFEATKLGLLAAALETSPPGWTHRRMTSQLLGRLLQILPATGAPQQL